VTGADGRSAEALPLDEVERILDRHSLRAGR
jgi:hypothetical protein